MITGEHVRETLLELNVHCCCDYHILHHNYEIPKSAPRWIDGPLLSPSARILSDAVLRVASHLVSAIQFQKPSRQAASLPEVPSFAPVSLVSRF